MRDSCNTGRLPCVVCQVKNIQCSYKNDLSSCEACRKSKIRCIKQMPLGQHCQISPSFVDVSMEANKDPGKSGESGIMEHRSVVDLSRDTGAAGPTIPVPNSYPGQVLKCRRCGTIDHCAGCPESEGYRFPCEICGHQYQTCKLGRPTPNAPPPINNHRVHKSSPPLNEKSETFNGDGAVVGLFRASSLDHHSVGKKRRASASEAIQKDQEVVKRAKNNEASRKHQARMAREYEELRNGVLEDELALLRRVAGRA